MIRKITALFLLVVFLLNGAGFMNVYQFMHNKTSRMLREAQSRRDEILTITVNRAAGGLEGQGIKRLGKSEYLYRGRRYDVLRRDEKEDHTILHLVHDSYEEELLSFLTSFFSNTSNNSRSRSLSVLKKNIKKQYLAAGYTIPRIYGECYRFTMVQFVLPSTPYREILSPPPKKA